MMDFENKMNNKKTILIRRKQSTEIKQLTIMSKSLRQVRELIILSK